MPSHSVQGRDVVEDRVVVVGALEVVIGDPWAEVVDVVQPDVAREELKDLWQLQVRAAPKSGRRVGPGVVALPVNVFELVLHVEQPDASGAGEHRGRELHEQNRLPANERAQRADQRDERDIGGHDLAPKPPTRPSGHEPGFEHHRPQRSEDEHHERVAHQPVLKPARPGARDVLPDRERFDVSHAAMV